MFVDVLERLIEEGIIDEVRGRLMSGKEASVFIVERDGALLAAKVYKERDQRTFRATADYTEGRNQTRNSRDKRAMGKRTRYGKELVEESWRDMEYRALNEAFDAGVRVPEPVLLYDNVLLMELLVDEDGAPASRLAEFDLTPEVAELLHREIYGQVRLLLASGKVHGDLSAFNILMTPAGPTLIDIPQVVDASSNNKAAEILTRDLKNITEHLARFDPRLLRFRDCGDVLWRHYQRGTLDRALVPEEGGTRAPGKRGRPARETRSRNERPRDQRPAAPRPTEQRRDEPRRNEPRRSEPRPSDDRPRQQRPNDQRPNEQRPREQRPNDQRAREQRPNDQRAREQRPNDQRPPEQRPNEQRPNDQRPNEQRSREQRPNDQRPREQRPGNERPSGERAGTERKVDDGSGSPRGRSRRRRRAGGSSKADTPTP